VVAALFVGTLAGVLRSAREMRMGEVAVLSSVSLISQLSRTYSKSSG
jgi:hypothetical protein